MRLYLVLPCVIASSCVFGQWEVRNLDPDIPNFSTANGVGAAYQAGYTQNVTTNVTHAAMWFGTAASYVDMHPVHLGVPNSRILGARGNQQVGSRFGPSPQNFAVLWTGSAASAVNLHPGGSYQTTAASGTDGDRQIGTGVQFGGFIHAVYWNDTPGSMIDLHPTGASQSTGRAIFGNRQGGEVDNKPALWTGSAGSYVDLTPAGYTAGAVNAMDATHEGGSARTAGGGSHAGLWSGTAGSFVNLNPSGSVDSVLNGMDGGYQVGWADFDPGGANAHAALWQGTAGSFFDLHLLLPAHYTSSMAEAIAIGGDGTIYVVGRASGGGASDAVLWIHPVPEPASMLALGAGGMLLLRRRRRG